MLLQATHGAEAARLAEDTARVGNWKRWGPYLAERQWGTVREDYSASGDAWRYFPHEQARSRAYRWGEDGLLGFCDRECRLCFAVALWNECDPILKERLFGLTGPEGNHGEDVKEEYYYLDSTPTHSYCRALYKYPQRRFPYEELAAVNAARGKQAGEYELADTGAFADDRYWDVLAEYAKAGPNDLLIRLTLTNRGPDPAALHVLPTLWFRNTWSWGCRHEGCTLKPLLRPAPHSADDLQGALQGFHETLGEIGFAAAPGAGGEGFEWLVTDNETNNARLFQAENLSPYVKDAFHAYVIQGRRDAVNPERVGSKAAAHYRLRVMPGWQAVVRLRLWTAEEAPAAPFGPEFDEVFAARQAEADEYYTQVLPAHLAPAERAVARQAYAGLLWSKQFYHYIVPDWLQGDPQTLAPPAERHAGRNSDWPHLYSRDVLSMPDKWEYPWFAAWDAAFHMLPCARLDPAFSKDQLQLLLREWYLHPNGQIPAYEWNFSDVNPPVHAWACWRVYKLTGDRGARDRRFLASVFQKLLLNFTWWVNRKDARGKHLFSGGFLGLDNIGVFDRSQPLPTGGVLEQADGTAWMAFYCLTMLAMALELARTDPVFEDIASKFFEHFTHIADAMNALGGAGLWDEADGFYYDEMRTNGGATPLRVRSLVGLIPLLAVEILHLDDLHDLPGFRKRMAWFARYRADLSRHISYLVDDDCDSARDKLLLAIPSRQRLERLLVRLFDEREFLSPYGVRSLSKHHEHQPYVLRHNGQDHCVRYTPGESDSYMFGGNSNWRGPIWFPLNYLLIEALERYDYFYGDALQVEYPTGSGRKMRLGEAADDLSARLVRLFLPDAAGRRPCHGDDARYTDDPAYRDLVLFHEYFHGDTGRGLGASHQTGWTALAARLLEKRAARRAAAGGGAPR